MKKISYLEFFQQKQDLEPGTYLVQEHDDTESVAILEEFGQVTWMSVEEFEEKEREFIHEMMILNDGMDLIYD